MYASLLASGDNPKSLVFTWGIFPLGILGAAAGYRSGGLGRADPGKIALVAGVENQVTPIL